MLTSLVDAGATVCDQLPAVAHAVLEAPVQVTVLVTVRVPEAVSPLVVLDLRPRRCSGLRPTLIAHDELALIEPPESVIEVLPAAGVNVPPQVFCCAWVSPQTWVPGREVIDEAQTRHHVRVLDW